MKVLIVEDMSMQGLYLQKGLTEAGFVTDWLNNGNDALVGGLTQSYDAVVLDIGLPGVDGWHILQSWRGAGKNVPVLMLTARDDVQDRIKGLELGADDYLVKPFVFAELVARLRSIIRRSQNKTPVSEVLRAADLEMDCLRRRVSRDGRRINLTPKEFALLELLLRRCGEVLPRSLIASLVWDMNFDSDTNVIDVAVRRLRAKVDEGFKQRLIHTVRGAGYVLESGRDEQSAQASYA